MSAGVQTVPISNRARWTGRVLSGIAVFFLLFDATIKIIKSAPAVEGTVALGYPAGVIRPLGFVVLACVILYLVPRTAVFGAVLLTGFLGGAIATQVRVSNPWPAYILAPVYVAVFIWGGLFLRDRRVRALISRGVSS